MQQRQKMTTAAGPPSFKAAKKRRYDGPNERFCSRGAFGFGTYLADAAAKTDQYTARDTRSSAVCAVSVGMLRVHLLVVIFCADPMQQVRQTFVGWPAYGDYASGIYSRTCKRILSLGVWRRDAK